MSSSPFFKGPKRSIQSGFSNRKRNPFRLQPVESLESRLAPAVLYWDGGANDGSWNSVANWSTLDTGGDDPGAIPGASDDVIFNASALSGVDISILGADQAVNSITFAANSTTPITIAAGNTLTVGSAITVEAGAAAHAIAAPIILGANVTVTQGETTNALTISGAVSGTGFGIVKAGAGTLTLSGNSTYDGTTQLDAGTLRVVTAPNTPTVVNPLGASSVVVNGGTLALSNATTYANALGHAGFHVQNDNFFFDIHNNDGALNYSNPTTGASFEGLGLLTDGPGARGLDFNSDADIQAALANLKDDAVDGKIITNGDNYSNLFFGTFTPNATGSWTFRINSEDDESAIWIDLDQDGVFESSTAFPFLGSNQGEQLLWNGVASQSRSLVAGEKYLVAFMHGENTGSANIDMQIQGPSFPMTTVKPTDPNQAGFWSFTDQTLVSLGNNVTVNANATITSDGVVGLGSLTVNAAATQINFQSTHATGTLPAQVRFVGGATLDGNKTFNFTNSFNLTQAGGVIQDGANPGGFTTAGRGVINLSGANTFTGNVTIAANGLLLASNSSSLGSETTGKTIVQSGATLDIRGQRVGATGNELVEIEGDGIDGFGALLNRSADQTAAFRRLTLTGDTTIRTKFRIDVRDTGGPATFDMGGFSVNKVGEDEFVLVNATVANPGDVSVANNSIFRLEGTTEYDGGTITVGDGEFLDFHTNTQSHAVNVVLNTNSALTTNDGAGAGPTIEGTVQFAGNTTLTLEKNLTISGDISGAGTPTINAAGATLTLSGDNSFTAAMNVTSGWSLIARTPTALGAVSGRTEIAFNSSLIYDAAGGAFIAAAEPVRVSGAGVGNAGAIQSQGGDVTLNGPMNIRGSDTVFANNTPGTTLTLQGAITLESTNGIVVKGSGDIVFDTEYKGNEFSLSSFNARLFMSDLFNLADQATINNLAVTDTPAQTATLSSALAFATNADAAFTTLFGGVQPGAADFTAAFVTTMTVYSAGTFEFAATNNDDAAAVWIDRDQDGVFETAGANGNERLQGEVGSGNTSIASVNLTPGNYLVVFAFEDTGGSSALTGRIRPAGNFPVAATSLPTATPSLLTTARDYLLQDSSGTTTLSGNNAYKGVTLVNQGTLVVAADNALGSAATVTADIPLSPMTQLWQVGTDNNSNSEFGQESFASNAAPGSATVKDDDWYFAGTYDAPIGVLATNEATNLFERALTISDPTDRIHFNLAADKLDDNFQLVIDVIQSDFTGGNIPITVSFNGVTVHTQTLTANTTITVPTFSGLTVGAITGDNVVQITRGGTGAYIQFDFIRLNSQSVVAGVEDTLVKSGATLGFSAATYTAAEIVHLEAGSTLQATAGASSFPGPIDLLGDAAFDAAAFASLTLAGAIGDGAGAFGFEKTGPGTISLTGTNTYEGATDVLEGILIVGGSAALGSSSAVNVAGGATFEFNPSSPSTLTLNGAFDLADASKLRIAVGSTIAVTGAATTAGTVNIAVFGSVAPGTYTLVTAASGLLGAAYNITLSNPIDFIVTATSITDTEISITVANATPLASAYWIGGLSGNPGVWSASNGGASNWTTDGAGTATPLVPGSGADVIFSDVGSTAGNQAAMTLGANTSINSLTINGTVGSPNNTDPVTLLTTVGSNLTIGNGILVNAGAGAVTLDPNIIFANPQTVTNNSANPLSLGSAPTSVSNGANLLTLAGTGVIHLSNVTTGAGGLAVAGSATVSLLGTTTLNDAQTWANNSSNPLSVASLSNGANLLTLEGTGAFNIANFTAGSGGLTVSSTGNPTVTLTGATLIASPQTWNLNSSNLFTVSGGTLAGAALNLDGASDIDISSDISAPLTLAGGGNADISGSLNASLTRTGGGNTTVSGPASGNITQAGAGTFTLSGGSAGGLTISNGIMNLIGATNSVTTIGITGGITNFNGAVNNGAGLTISAGTVNFNGTTSNTYTTTTATGGIIFAVENTTATGTANFDTGTTTINTGPATSITFTGAVNVGNNNAGNLTLGTDASFIMDASGSNFVFGNRTSGAAVNNLFNASAARNVSITANNVQIGTTSGTPDHNPNNPLVTFTLPTGASSTSTIAAGTGISVGLFEENGATLSAVFNLGGGSNTITTPSISLGDGKAGAFFGFQGGSAGSLNLSESGGDGKTNLVIGFNDATGTGVNPLSNFDLTTTGAVNATLGQIILGSKSGSSNANGGAKGTFTLNADSSSLVTADEVAIGLSDGDVDNVLTGTFNLGGGTFQFNSGGLGFTNAGGTVNSRTSAINVSGGVLDMNGTPLAAISAGAGTSTLSLTGGTIQDASTVGNFTTLTFTGGTFLNSAVAAQTIDRSIVQESASAASTFQVDASQSTSITGSLTANGGSNAATVIINGSLTTTTGLAIGNTSVATLMGSGAITGNITIGVNGILAPGNSIGTLTANEDVVLAGTSDFEVTKGGVPADQVTGIDQLTYGGILKITGVGAGSFAPGNSWDLFNFSGFVLDSDIGFANDDVFGTDGSLDPNMPDLPEGLTWEFDYETGVLSIATSLAAPTVTSIVPVIGPTTGGTIVNIYGVNFVDITSVTFGNTVFAPVSFTLTGTTQITVTSPSNAGVPGTVDVVVSNAAGDGTLVGVSDFTYAKPAVDSVVVNGGSGVVLGGSTWSLAGQNSVVKQILVTFNQAVTVASDAFTVTPVPVSLTESPGPGFVYVSGGAAPSPNAATTSVTMLTASTYLVTFVDDAADPTPSTHAGGILNSGVYDLNVIASKVTANGEAMASNQKSTFYAIFGTVNANNSLTTIPPGYIGDGFSSAFVDPGALFRFSDTFGSNVTNPTGPPAYDITFDYNLDGAIDPGDLFAFSDSFGINWDF